MKFGVSTMLREDGISATSLARALEERGFESLFHGEHSHIPVHPASPIPQDSAQRMARLPDPFVVLSAAAAVTERLRVGTSVTLIAQRDPIQTAKTVASLDQISGGRVILGIGIGWQREEMRNHGTDPSRRAPLTRERVLAMKEIWANDEAEFHGRHVDFDPIYAWPKPAQRPHPPILVGGSGRPAFERVLDYGDGWIALYYADPDGMGAAVRQLQELAADRGRGPVPVTVSGVRPSRQAVAGLEEMGVERVLFDLPAGSPDESLDRLDEYVKLTGR
jgi:probable F420-dependent oxidoreductase